MLLSTWWKIAIRKYELSNLISPEIFRPWYGPFESLTCLFNHQGPLKKGLCFCRMLRACSLHQNLCVLGHPELFQGSNFECRASHFVLPKPRGTQGEGSNPGRPCFSSNPQAGLQKTYTKIITVFRKREGRRRRRSLAEKLPNKCARKSPGPFYFD